MRFDAVRQLLPKNSLILFVALAMLCPSVQRAEYALERYDSISFGTAGIRGDANQFPFTHEALYAIGYAIGTWCVQKYGNAPRILIARDTRESGIRIITSMVAGLCAHNVTCISAGILPTPDVLALIRADATFNAGIVITASHNPAHDNGIKIFDRTHGYIEPDDEQSIETHFAKLITQNKLTIPSPKTLTPLTDDISFGEKYKQLILRYFPPNMLDGCTIVLDCAHGASYQIAPALFRTLGAHVITIGTSPTGTNINQDCGALHLKTLIETVQMYHADFGIAFDGDADRVMVVNRHGVIKDGDDILAILAQHPHYSHETYLVSTIMGNHGLAHYLAAHHKTMVRVAVGERQVTTQLHRHNVHLGGENNGHIVMTDYLDASDGVFTALRMLETAMLTKNYNLDTFEKFPQILINVPVVAKPDLAKAPFAKIIDTYTRLLPEGRVVVRYSGTESLLRVMTEDRDKQRAEQYAQELAQKLSDAISQYNAHANIKKLSVQHIN